MGYRIASGGYLRKENENSTDDNENDSTNSNGNGNGGNGSGSGNGGSNGGGMSESKSGDSSLRDWFGKSRSSDGKPGWVQLGGKYAGKPCAKQPGQTTKPKCGSSKMAANLDDKEEQKAFNRKQRQDPNPNRKGKAINVKTEETVVEKAGEKDACYKKVKSRYSVWPSAYASGALVKCRKKGAANWGNKSEEIDYKTFVSNARAAAGKSAKKTLNKNKEKFLKGITKPEELKKQAVSDSFQYSNWKDDFQATEYEFVDIIKAEPLISESPSFEIKKTTEVQGPEVPKEKQWNAGPASKRTKEGIDRLKKKLKKEEVETIDELKCWKGYKRKKGSIPGEKGSCVKAHVELEGEHIEERKDDTDIGEKTGKKVPRKNISDANRYEMEKRRRKNLNKRPGDAPGDSKLIRALRDKAKETGNYAEEKEESKVGGGNLKKLTAKAVRRVDADVDGDVDTNDMKSSETGVFVPSPDGKKLKPKVRFEGASDWRNELDEGWKSALAGAGVAAALMSQGGQKAPDKKTTTSPSRSNTERVSKTTQKKLSPMDQWRKNHPKLANKSDNPPEFKRKKLSPINKDWAKANPKLAEKEKDNRSKLGEGAAWTKKSGKNKKGGLNEKGRKSYEAENPGSDLKAPSKKVGNPRRKSFCARMKGMRKRQKPSNNTGDDRLSKSLRAWNC